MGDELSEQEWTEFSKYFLPKYNAENNTSFGLIRPSPVSINSDCDFIDAAGNTLALQHTRAVGTQNDISMEIVRPKHSEKFINLLYENLLQKGVSRCHISLNISNPPRNNDEIRSAVYWVSELIRMKTEKENRDKIFSYDRQDDDLYIGRASKWISGIDIFPDTNFNRPSFGWSKFPIESLGVLDSVQRFTNALARKLGKNYTNISELLLLIDFSPFPFDEGDITGMKEVSSKLNPGFKSIWVYQLWSGATGAFKIE